ncbi:MAG: hypothetical protein ACLRFE_00485 [Clostridia bacterium]
MKINELSRNKSVNLYKNQGYSNIDGKIVKGKELKAKLCSLFLSRYKQTLTEKQAKKLQVYYADMVEVIITLMEKTKAKFKNPFADKKQQALLWYKGISPSKTKLADVRIDLMQKFYEFILMETEAIKDQLNDIITSLYELVEAHGLEFAKVEQTRKIMRENLGGFSKGVYLESVSKTKTQAHAV